MRKTLEKTRENQTNARNHLQKSGPVSTICQAKHAFIHAPTPTYMAFSSNICPETASVHLVTLT